MAIDSRKGVKECRGQEQEEEDDWKVSCEQLHVLEYMYYSIKVG